MVNRLTQTNKAVKIYLKMFDVSKSTLSLSVPDLFIAVDRKCGPLSLSSTFRHLVQYVRHAISLLKNAPRE